MRKQARITSKGQVTVPHEIRRLLGVRTGDRLVFEGDHRGVRLRRAQEASPFAKFRGIGNAAIGEGRRAVVRWVRQLRGQ
jgi:AbrB family looped-hinge helix DNA binding protein